jgi:Transmembrane protein 65
LTKSVQFSSSPSSAPILQPPAASSTAAMGSKSKGVSAVPRPPWSALRVVFFASAVPMVGFGFMDNIVMIQAGQYIDTTLGVSFGLATLTAAAMGQVLSDVSGVLFGGTLERLLQRAGLVPNVAALTTLTLAQKQLPITRNTGLAGAVVGVMIGCCLGATSLLFMDLEERDRLQHAVTLRNVVHDVLTSPPPVSDGSTPSNQFSKDILSLSCHSCTIYLVKNAEKYDLGKLPTQETNGDTGTPSCRTYIRLIGDAPSTSLVHTCAQTRDVILDRDDVNVVEHPTGVEKSPTPAIGHRLYVPVMHDQEVIAVLELNRGKRKPPPLKRRGTFQLLTGQAQPPVSHEHEDSHVDSPGSLSQIKPARLVTRTSAPLLKQPFQHFTDSDEHSARLLAHHISVFMKHLVH